MNANGCVCFNMCDVSSNDYYDKSNGMNMCDVLLKYKCTESNNLECNQISVTFGFHKVW